MPLQPSTIIYSCPWQMSQSAFFPAKPSVQLYSDRKPRACQKFRNGPGIGKCPAPGPCKICKCPTPGTDKAGKYPAVAWGRGGGVGWLQVELTDALVIAPVPQDHEWESLGNRNIIRVRYLGVKNGNKNASKFLTLFPCLHLWCFLSTFGRFWAIPVSFSSAVVCYI